MKEAWKSIKGFEDYTISSYGRIKSIKPYLTGKSKGQPRNRILKYRINTGGYYSVNLYRNKKMYVLVVHRLILIAFIPNPENKPQCNHKDGNKLNNNITNLEWCSAKENVHHYFKYLYNGERKGIPHKYPNTRDNSFHQYEATITNLLTNESIVFNCLRTASVYMNKRHNYLTNWIYKNKPVYKNKQYSWKIKKEAVL